MNNISKRVRRSPSSWLQRESDAKCPWLVRYDNLEDINFQIQENKYKNYTQFLPGVYISETTWKGAFIILTFILYLSY